MLVNRAVVIASVICAMGASAHAQPDREITAAANPSPKQVRSWLRRGDPRLVAWGAYFASRNSDQRAETLMVHLAENWSTPPPNSAWSYKADAMSEILYALIQRHEIVPLKALAAVATSFPDQAVILAARLPVANVTPLLEKWYYSGEAVNQSQFDSASINSRFLARIAAMMLAKTPPPRFAANVLEKSQEHLNVYVVISGGVGGGGGSAVCGDTGGGLPPPGWPMIFFYATEENNPRTKDPLLVEAGGDRITWRLVPITMLGGTCYGVRQLNDENRHHLLAAMLGIQDEKMPWTLRQDYNIVWGGEENCRRELQSDINSEEAKLRLTVDDFYKKGLLTRTEAASVRPKLSVWVSDERKPAGPPLPVLQFRDPRTFYAREEFL